MPQQSRISRQSGPSILWQTVSWLVFAALSKLISLSYRRLYRSRPSTSAKFKLVRQKCLTSASPVFETKPFQQIPRISFKTNHDLWSDVVFFVHKALEFSDCPAALLTRQCVAQARMDRSCLPYKQMICTKIQKMHEKGPEKFRCKIRVWLPARHLHRTKTPARTCMVTLWYGAQANL